MTHVATSQAMTPVINVKIPSSFLVDSENSEDDAYMGSPEMSPQATLKSCEPRQLWPSPISEALQQLSKIDLSATNSPRSPVIDDLHANPSEDFMYDSAMFDPAPRVPPTSPADEDRKLEDIYTGCSQSGRKIVRKTGLAPGSVSPSRSMPKKAAAMKRHQYASSLLFKGGQARNHLRGAKHKARVPEQVQKGDSDAILTSQASTIPKVSSVLSDMTEKPFVSAKGFHRPAFDRTIKQSPSLNGLGAWSNIDMEAQEGGRQRLPSSVHEAEKESSASSPEVPRMGSRREWDKARADRDHRYFAIRSMDDDEKTEDDSESGLELQRSPAREHLQDDGYIFTGHDLEQKTPTIDPTIACIEMADAQKEPPESPRKLVLYAIQTTAKNLSDLNLGLPKDTQSGAAGSGLDPALEIRHKYTSQRSMAGHSGAVEAVLHRLIEGHQKWSSTSSYDSEDDVNIHYQEPCLGPSFSVVSAPSIDDHEGRNTGTKEVVPGEILSVDQSGILEEDDTRKYEETNHFSPDSLDAAGIWSRISKMDESRSTEFLKAMAVQRNYEDGNCALSEDECAPIDDSPVYLNPRPFPDLNGYRNDPNSASSMIPEVPLTVQVDRLALFAQQEANAEPDLPSSPEDAFAGFWADLGQELREYILGRQAAEANAHNQGGHNSTESWPCFEDMLKEINEVQSRRHEWDDPDRAFNAARLPCFNSVSSGARLDVPQVNEGGWGGSSSGPACGIKEAAPGNTACDITEVGASKSGITAHEHSAGIKAASTKVDATCRPQDGRDQTSPGKKGVWRAGKVEYINKANTVRAKKDDENKRRTSRVKTAPASKDKKTNKKCTHRVQELSEVENKLDGSVERRAR
jgi:hypothetical protein